MRLAWFRDDAGVFGTAKIQPSAWACGGGLAALVVCWVALAAAGLIAIGVGPYVGLDQSWSLYVRLTRAAC